MSNLFYYRREITKKVKVENPAEGEPTKKEVTETYWDCFNINKVVRGHWTKEDEFTVYLDDGHEQAEDVQKPVFKNGKPDGIEIKRERSWYISQIPMCREDALRFRAVSERGYREPTTPYVGLHPSDPVFEQ